MKKETLIKTTGKIVAVITFLVIADYLIQEKYKSYKKTYTVGILGDTIKPYGQDFQVRFNFDFNGLRRHSFNSIGDNNIESKTYLIEVPIRKPGRSRILWDYPVPDTLKAPYEGWEEIPAFLKKREGD
ncbi:hypothetical protein [Cyclobacterium plantarum]|uniref:DUF3592 domain-containing protein n=1 Tax=Cyclobacterium plantarum TaxID=2716263 RepID=A0ABX0HCL6_9BACT|nr:hypothetical protein [Cyclobacterium plantarum]NHE57916.1 hypothetical protein [Cyclobacterium plantarum]